MRFRILEGPSTARLVVFRREFGLVALRRHFGGEVEEW